MKVVHELEIKFVLFVPCTSVAPNSRNEVHYVLAGYGYHKLVHKDLNNARRNVAVLRIHQTAYTTSVRMQFNSRSCEESLKEFFKEIRAHEKCLRILSLAGHRPQ